MVVKPRNAELDFRFLQHLLRGGIDLSIAITGAAQPQITRQSLAPIRFKFPSLAEQRRIADILDQADALRAKRREALAQLDRLAQSIFVEMFGDPVTNPHEWAKVPFDQFFLDKTASCEKLPSSAYQDEGAFPIVDQGQVTVAGYCDDEYFLAAVPLPVTVFGDHTRAVKHVSFPFVVGADGAKVLSPS